MSGVERMELRQLRYFVTLAEELHFGRAAAREHIVQSALSQQLARLERELGVALLERSTHHVRLTTAGSAFVIEARQILAHVNRATLVAQRAASAAPTLRVGIVDASYDSMPQILHKVEQAYPELEIHQVEIGVPEQFKLLADGRLDVGFGRASLAPAEVEFELVRLDPLGVLVAPDHRFAKLTAVPVPMLTEEPMLLGEEERTPEFNQFVVELCRSVGFLPNLYHGTVESIRAAADLVMRGSCVHCVPASCASSITGIVWRPLNAPVSSYPWSVLWRTGEHAEQVRAVVGAARTLSAELGWLPKRSHERG
jgi:DNA-binding transcriptional LysR family regulator